MSLSPKNIKTVYVKAQDKYSKLTQHPSTCIQIDSIDSDNQVLASKSSQKVDNYLLCYHMELFASERLFPGGHPEGTFDEISPPCHPPVFESSNFRS